MKRATLDRRSGLRKQPHCSSCRARREEQQSPSGGPGERAPQSQSGPRRGRSSAPGPNVPPLPWRREATVGGGGGGGGVPRKARLSITRTRGRAAAADEERRSGVARFMLGGRARKQHDRPVFAYEALLTCWNK
ncbi:hypothetical protein AOLI_G00239980 [Acnodon oligacanthus]